MHSKAQAPADTAMTRLYVLVFICEALVIAALWGFGRAFS